MSPLPSRTLPFVLGALVLSAVGAAVAWSVYASTKPPEGPVDVVWDKSACSACGMHVGEPPFAAQVTTADGRSHVFDDPGCLFLWVHEHSPAVHTMFFHDHRSERWITADRVAFVEVQPTPMGFGIV